MRWMIVSLVAFALAAAVSAAWAQGPLDKLAPKDKQETLPRLPDDQIEGTIWEYKATPKDKPKEGEEVPELEGRFRTEGKAIFDVSRRLPIPEKKKVEKTVDDIKKGKVKDIKLPEGPQQKRLGEYRTITGGKLRLDFNDKESLNGLMVIWPKKDTADVWMGTYTQKDGKKTVREWIVEVRPIED